MPPTKRIKPNSQVAAMVMVVRQAQPMTKLPKLTSANPSSKNQIQWPRMARSSSSGVAERELDAMADGAMEDGAAEGGDAETEAFIVVAPFGGTIAHKHHVRP